MIIHAYLLGGALATLILTVVMIGSQYLGWTRMSLPLIAGTMVTPDRDRAMTAGTGIHFVIGMVLAAGYAAFFELWGHSAWWAGSLLGLLHGAVVLLAVLPALPGVHPLMAAENQGPAPTAALEPPGLWGKNYGRPTAVVTLVAHLLYGTAFAVVYGLAQ